MIVECWLTSDGWEKIGSLRSKELKLRSTATFRGRNKQTKTQVTQMCNKFTLYEKIFTSEWNGFAYMFDQMFSWFRGQKFIFNDFNLLARK